MVRVKFFFKFELRLELSFRDQFAMEILEQIWKYKSVAEFVMEFLETTELLRNKYEHLYLFEKYAKFMAVQTRSWHVSLCSIENN